MRRREFLQGTAGGALAWQLAVWSAACGRAAAQESGAPSTPPLPWTAAAEIERLRASAQVARDRKRPLLLLILPENRTLRWEHGKAWGELVLHGPPRAVAALATCELACARLLAAREVFAGLMDLPDEGCAALVLELETRSVRPVRVDLAVKRSPYPTLEADESLRARIRRIAAALEAALARDAATLDLRLRAVARDRGVNLAPEDSFDPEALAKLVRVQLGATPPAGAAWASDSPCSVHVDHPLAKNLGGPCGTGFVPRLSERFLFYFVDLEHALMDVNLRRRELLKRTLAGAFGVQLAAWTGACTGAAQGDPVAEGLPDAPAEELAGLDPLHSGWSRAQRTGRPLFVLVIPTDGQQRGEHGRAWGELLLHGSVSTLARLAACDLVCADLASVQEVLAGAEVPAGGCTALLAVPAGQGSAGPPRVAALDVDLTLERTQDWLRDRAADERPHRERIARLERALDELLDERTADPRRLQGEPPPGGAWATDVGCGFEVAGHPERRLAFGCGMAHVPDIAKRFLYYLVDREGG